MGLLKRVTPDTEVTAEDEAYVLALCDKSKTGTILRSEALAAAANWKHLIMTGEAPSQQKSGLCTLV